ncbi:MAG: TlpA disulfide reductase family protein [Gammaproteobacteria bacterium]
MKYSIYRMSDLLKSGMYPAVLVTALMLTVSLCNAGELMDKVPNTEASNFTLMSAHGSDISLSDYEGKFVVLNFWATWCPPCVKEMPALNKLHNKLSGSSLEVVGVHVGPALATVKQFLKDKPVDFDILIDKNMSLSSWQVSGLPTTFLISPSGKVIYKATGEREWGSDEMVKFIRGVMKEYERLAYFNDTSSKS